MRIDLNIRVLEKDEKVPSDKRPEQPLADLSKWFKTAVTILGGKW